MRKTLAIQVLLVAASVGCETVAPGASAPSEALPALAQLADTPQTLEEDFSYPNAEDHRASGIILKRGDGNLLLADCATDAPIEIETILHGTFCFDVRGPRADLELELDDTYLAITSTRVRAKVRLDGTRETSLDLTPPSTSLTIGNGQSAVTLLALHVGP